MDLNKSELGLVVMLCKAQMRFLENMEDLGVQVLPLRRAVLDLQAKAQEAASKTKEEKPKEE